MRSVWTRLMILTAALSLPLAAHMQGIQPAVEYSVEVGRFSDRAAAERYLSLLKQKGLDARLGVIKAPQQGSRISVLIGSFGSAKAASRHGRHLLASKSIERFNIRSTTQVKTLTRSRRINPQEPMGGPQPPALNQPLRDRGPASLEVSTKSLSSGNGTSTAPSAEKKSEPRPMKSSGAQDDNARKSLIEGNMGPSVRSKSAANETHSEAKEKKERLQKDNLPGSTRAPPEEIMGDPQPSYLLPLADLGFTTRLRLSGAMTEQTLSVPIHSGQRPLSLSALLQIAPGVGSGYLLIANQEVSLLTMPLPKTEVTISVSLAKAVVKHERLNLLIRVVMNPGQDSCAAHKLQWVELSDFSITCSGTAQPPTTVAEFWPPDITDLKICVSPNPDMAESRSALILAVFAARMAVGHPLRVTVEPLEPSAPWPIVPADPFNRTVVVRSDVVAEMSLVTPREGEWPLLLVTGSPDKLPQMVEQLVGSARPLLLAGRGDVMVIQQAQPEIITEKTLAELGYMQIQMQGAGQMEAHMLFAQSDFGGAVSDVAVRLAGTYSPIPEGGGAHLALLLNGGLVFAQPLGQEGKFDFYAPFPESLLRRDNSLVARVSYTPPGGDCRMGVHEIILRIDGGSYLQVQHGQKLPAGFERFPQVFLPEFQVAFDRLTPEAVDSAAQLVTSLQRLSHWPLRPRVVSWDEGLKSKEPLLAIALDPTKTEALNPPLGAAPFRILDNEGNQLLRLEVDARFAVLQAFVSKGRDVVLLTQRDWVRGLSALTRVLNQEDGWYNLNGDVWLMPADQQPYALRLRDSGLRIEPLHATPLIWWQRFRFVLFLVAFAVVVFFLFWIYPRVVRKRPVGAKAG